LTSHTKNKLKTGNDLAVLIAKARLLTDRHFGRKIVSMTPNPAFPSVSITGTRCSLHCAHCNHHYLAHMVQTLKPDDLLRFALSHYSKGGLGFLISGGFTREKLTFC